ncbi:glycosyltransferase [Arcobacter sp. F2176]|uniref:glycosyltransferase n=1 Tax=Arcobacter sp. F2176 TaxID=2044511 RepID=UPI00100A9E4B|nr:glycosyltransferase [Arcobacter sp. F2176]RXJ81112.1 hypothetical protein CRU95_09345 [Arcobacter sp. F2176]
MKNKISINQYSPAIAYGDGISNSLIFIQSLLIELGFDSKIYIHKKSTNSLPIKNEFFYINEYRENPNNFLIYQFSTKDPNHELIMKFKDKKIMLYQNITPSHFFEGISYKEISNFARKQLSESVNSFIAAISMSEYSTAELLKNNYKNVSIIPLLVDSRKNDNKKINQNLLKKYDDSFNILFVGRVIQNKCQHNLIDVLYHLKLNGEKNIKLFIVGRDHYPEYFKFLFEYTKNLGLEKDVIITGPVDDNDLHTYYQISDLYLSLSEHEGFGMPIIEAMNYKIPVLAYDSGAIPSTLGKNGLLKKKNTSFISKEILKVKNNTSNRNSLIKKQQIHLKEFNYINVKEKFHNFLIQVTEDKNA